MLWAGSAVLFYNDTILAISWLFTTTCRPGQVNPTGDGESVSAAAEEVFRDLICKAAYNNLKSVLHPVLS